MKLPTACKQKLSTPVRSTLLDNFDYASIVFNNDREFLRLATEVFEVMVGIFCITTSGQCNKHFGVILNLCNDTHETRYAINT